MGQAHRVDIAGQMEIEVFHRHYLRISSAGRAPFDSEYRAERRLTDTNSGALADSIQGHREADCVDGFPFAQGGRRYCSDINIFTVLSVPETL